MTLLHIAYRSYKEPAERAELNEGIDHPDKRKRSDWIRKGVLDAVDLVQQKTDSHSD